MVPRILNGNMRPVLLKLEKLPLGQLRNAGKTTISSSNNGNTEDANCKKCEKLIAKAFNIDDKESTVYATTAKRDEEKLTQKLETIEEQPLVEAEPKVESFNVSPKILRNKHHTSHSIDPNLQNIYGADKRTTLDDIAVKLMSLPSNEIDRKLKEKFETYGNCLRQKNIKTDELYDNYNKKTEEAINRTFMRCNERPVISDNGEVVEKKQSDILVGKSIDRAEDVLKNSAFISKREDEDKQLSKQSLPFYREYEIHLKETSSENTCRAEKPQPMHIDVEFLTFIEKSSSRERILKKLEEPGSGQFIKSCELAMIPLPSNETAISSQASKISTEGKSEMEQDDIKKKPILLNTANSFNTLPKSIERGDSISEKYYQTKEMGTFKSNALSDLKSRLLDQTHRQSLSTTIADLSSTRISSKDKQNKSANAESMNKQENAIDEEDLSLSELLRRIRQRNKREKDNESELKVLRCSETEPWLSKSTCLPPLDLRPRSKQCPPSPCPKKDPCKPSSPCPPQPKTPCPSYPSVEKPFPVPKNPCKPPPICPSPKNPCPTPCPPPKEPRDPCPRPQDPCKPPPVCPPPKSPCPCPSPKSNPCGFYIGNKFKDTITLILCDFASTNIFRNAFGLSTLNCNLPYNVGNNSRDLMKASVTEDVFLRLGKLGNQDLNFQYKNIVTESETRYEQVERREEVMYARSFKPWTPIPSWPMPKKEVKKRFVCPKQGCKLPTPHSTHSKDQYKETPSTNSRCPKFSVIDAYFIP